MTTGLLSSRDHARGVLKKELLAHLRSRRIMRRGKTSSTGDQTRGQADLEFGHQGSPTSLLVAGRPSERNLGYAASASLCQRLYGVED